MKILNLTQHLATPDQIAAGVVDLQGDQRRMLVEWLTFEEIPDEGEMADRAADLAQLVGSNGLADEDNADDPVFWHAMIGGAPFFMRKLEDALVDLCVQPWYAFSRRESVEQVQPDGSVRKVAEFRHIGFVPGRRVPE